MYVPASIAQSLAGQAQYGTKPYIPAGQTALFSPGVPLPAQAQANPGGKPIQFNFPPQYNSFSPQRDIDNRYDIPSFEQLKRLALMDYGCALCERFWLDLVPKMELKISLTSEAIEGGAEEKDFVKQKAAFYEFFSTPAGDGEPLHSWLRRALINQSRYDGLFIYKNKARGGKLLGLEIINPAEMKPLLNMWGRVPQPPDMAYQQFPWGIPGCQYRTDQMIYYRESPADDTPFGFSRVERVIFITNLALRKQKQDMAHYTDGNVPAGILSPPEGSQWTPDQLDSYEQSWNALIAGNYQQLARIKVVQPGFTYTPFIQPSYDSAMDMFWLNIRTAIYGMTPADLGFTEAINKSTGETQQDVTFDRTVGPLAKIYAGILTGVMRTDFPPSMQGKLLRATFGGYAQTEDESDKATALSIYTGAGILGISAAAKIAGLPEDPDAVPIGRMLITATGPIFLDDVADPALRAAQTKSQLAGLQFSATNPGGPPPPPTTSDGTTEGKGGNNVDTKDTGDAPQSTSNGSTKDAQPANNGTAKAKNTDKPVSGDAPGRTQPVKRVVGEIDTDLQDAQRTDYKRWRDIALRDIKAGKQVRSFTSDCIPDAIHTWLSSTLEQCTTADEVRAVFASAQEHALSFFVEEVNGDLQPAHNSL